MLAIKFVNWKENTPVKIQKLETPKPKEGKIVTERLGLFNWLFNCK